VLGDVLPDADLIQFSFSPRLPFPHVAGQSTDLHVELDGATDLAGNPLRFDFPFVDFEIDPLESTQGNGSVVLRFNDGDLDEYTAPLESPAAARIDIRGQFFHDQPRGVVLPRPVATTGWPIDRQNPVPGTMTAVPTGVFTPITPLGAKIQTLWRYCDLGWEVMDETKFNMDVIGLNWSPVGGLVVRDFFNQFEMRLGHSRFLPDEFLDTTTGLPKYPNSGLPGAPAFFENNYLAGSNPKVVHNRALGYTINPSDLFYSTSNTPMMPYPLNRGLAPTSTYVWRDTSVLTRGADGDPSQLGVPLEAEAQAGLAVNPGSEFGPGEVPSFGLPLLIETKCFPSDLGLGLNLFDVSLSFLTAPTPNFRVYSAGGINTVGGKEIVLPDSEDFPAGGFNANSTPPGRKTTTTGDSVFYMGQLDTIVRISRVHTVWLDSASAGAPTWLTPVLEPANSSQPIGTGVVLDFRGASGFSGSGALAGPYNAAALDAFGNALTTTGGNGFTPQSLTDWSPVVSDANGRRFVQVRATFLNNISTGTSPELSVIALPFLD
jgi:hypothetical protein